MCGRNGWRFQGSVRAHKYLVPAVPVVIVKREGREVLLWFKAAQGKGKGFISLASLIKVKFWNRPGKAMEHLVDIKVSGTGKSLLCQQLLPFTKTNERINNERPKRNSKAAYLQRKNCVHRNFSKDAWNISSLTNYGKCLEINTHCSSVTLQWFKTPFSCRTG